MRKVSFLLALFGLFFLSAHAQYPYQVTAVPGAFGPATQTVGGITVKVSRVSSGGFGTCQSSSIPGGYCGVRPYWIGNDCGPNSRPGRNGYRYDFNKGVTDLRLRFVSLHDSDTVRVYIPRGFSPHVVPLNGATVAWSGTCTPTGSVVTFTADGRMTTTGHPSGNNDIEVDLQNPFAPYVFDSVVVDYTSKLVTRNNDGVVYDLWFGYDTCNLHFNMYADTPICTGRPITFHANDFPNTVHHWYNLVNSRVVTGGADDTIPATYPVNVLLDGLYIDSAVRGACVYRDTFNINVDVTPNKPVVTTLPPKCPGEADTVFASSNLTAGGTYSFYAQTMFGGFTTINYRNGQNYYEIKNIQASDAGTYYAYAQSPQGCVSDTGFVIVTVNTPAVADFGIIEHLGCRGDTMVFPNFSSGGTNKYQWDFGDGTSAFSFNRDTTHIYYTPYSAMPAVYHVKLTVGNGNCSDDTTVDLTINHPLKALFDVDFDTICQHTVINFVNNSVFTPATIPNYVWYFMDGDTATDVLGVAHTYDKVGIFNAELVVRDYLGCHDTETHTIIVDSVGSISFSPSDTNLCLGKFIDFYGTYSPIGINSATWDMNDGSDPILNDTHVRHSYTNPGTYTVSFAADYRICPDVTYTKTLTIKPFPRVDLGPDTTICPGGRPLSLRDIYNEGQADYTWRWNTATRDSSSSILVYHPGTYSVTASLNGCATTDSITIFKKCYIDIPNVFTPNGDGNNDYFLPRELLSRGITSFQMTIVNRWGGKVFETTSINGRGWDGNFNGEPQSTGVYVYMINVSFVNGDSEHYEGNITLLR